MSSRKLTEFPDVEAKLQKPTKQSAFERRKAEAEAKRQREESEAAAVLEEFVKSFDRDGDGPNVPRNDARGFGTGPREPARPGGFGGPPIHGGGSGKRHFQAGKPALRSGPGSLGPAATPWKKPWDAAGDDRRDRAEGKGRLAFGDHDIAKAFDASDDEGEPRATARAEEKAISKPTLRLASLPPGTSPAVIKALIPPNITVDGVKILPQSGPGDTDRKSTTAIVTLSKETAASDMDAAVSALQNRYLGFGYYLSLHRHLSSAAIAAPLTGLATTNAASHPFGAKPVPQPAGVERPVQFGRGRGFAPPSSYGPPGAVVNRAGLLHVPVRPPNDIKKLRMVHKVIESVLEHGPDFEALLMTRPDVQRDEKWAWIWDARSEAGVWYRYRMWQIFTGSKPKRGQGKFVPIFEDSHAWKEPEQPLPYEYDMDVDEFVSDSEYNSSDVDDDDFDDVQIKLTDNGGKEQEETFLNPMEKSKLVYLLARLPNTLGRLRKGDIARIAAFAITHASRGADEVVDAIVSNIERPFCQTIANPGYKPDAREKDEHAGSRAPSPGQEDKGASEAQDTSGASLIGLYVVSDILSTSSTSGVRHAWRYRQLFEAALRNRRVFEGLGLLAEKLQWGRLRAEKWKRSVGLVLGHWEGWCVFPAESQEHFVNSFENPPTLKKEERADEGGLKKGKWKPVDASTVKTEEPAAADGGDADGAVRDATNRAAEPEDDVDEPYMEYTDDEEYDMQCLDDDDIDGEPLLDEGMKGLSVGEDVPMADAAPPSPEAKAESAGNPQLPPAKSSRKRMRAVDMFADSDSEG